MIPSDTNLPAPSGPQYGEFLAKVAHELRNHLAPISNVLQVLKAAESNPEQIQQIREIIERQIQEMSQAIDRLQQGSQPQVGETDVRRIEPADRPQAARAVVPKLQVLVVDDVPASGKTLGLLLQSIGQDVAVIHDGAATVDWVVKHRPDVVFLDIAMPGVSGYDVAREIRRRTELADVRLVAVTGFGQEKDRREAIDAGFDHHLTKPASVEALERLLVASAPLYRPIASPKPIAP